MQDRIQSNLGWKYSEKTFGFEHNEKHVEAWCNTATGWTGNLSREKFSKGIPTDLKMDGTPLKDLPGSMKDVDHEVIEDLDMRQLLDFHKTLKMIK